MNIRQFISFVPQEPRRPSLPMIIAFHFATLFHPLRPLDVVMTQQLRTRMRDLTARYLPKQQSLSEPFPKAFRKSK